MPDKRLTHEEGDAKDAENEASANAPGLRSRTTHSLHLASFHDAQADADSSHWSKPRPMKSPNEARPTSTPKPVTGKKCCDPVVTKRITPTSKTSPRLFNAQTTG
jgi:hypothetical protein